MSINNYLLDNVKEYGIVNIINKYISELQHVEKMKKINIEIRKTNRRRMSGKYIRQKRIVEYKYEKTNFISLITIINKINTIDIITIDENNKKLSDNSIYKKHKIYNGVLFNSNI